MNPPPLSLYVHLPWCERKCPYCDFNSHEAATLPERDYIKALLLDLESDLIHLRGRAVHTVFIGGGTPSLFSAAAMADLLAGIAARLPLATDAEITMEANPGSAERERFRGYREAGINRLSLGIQSFDDQCLRALGRIHDAAAARRAVEAALTGGFRSVNLDLMHGLPGQSPAMALADLSTAAGFAPPHLSWYQLTIEPNTVFHRRPPVLPVEDTLADIQDEGEQFLHDAGYRRYEVSAWSRPGHQCRHNLNYWRFGDYIGIGAGAHGKVTLENGQVSRYAKTRVPDHYLRAGRGEHTANSRIVEEPDLPGEFMLNLLRLEEGFKLTDYTAATGLDATPLRHTLAELCERELMHSVAGSESYRLTPLGHRFLDSVVAEFFPG